MSSQAVRQQQSLSRRLEATYDAALRTALRREQRSIARLTNTVPIDEAHARYLLWRVERDSGLIANISAELARAGETAQRMISNESLNLFVNGYRDVTGNLQRQLRQAGIHADWNVANRNSLNAIFNGEYTALARQQGFRPAFTQVGFREIERKAVSDRVRSIFYRDRAYGRLGDNSVVVSRLQQQLAQSIILGEDVRRITQRIQSIGQMSMRQARTIARTETIRAFNQGSFLGATQAASEHGLELEKMWHHTAGQQHPREPHQDAAGTTVLLNEPFIINGSEMMYPQDPNAPASETVNCQCTVTYRVRGLNRAATTHERETLSRQMADERRAERNAANNANETLLFDNNDISDLSPEDAILHRLNRLQELGISTGNEHLFIMDKSGNVLFHNEGNHNSVGFTKEMNTHVFNAPQDSIIIAHNHPGGSSFSADDMKTLGVNSIGEIHAVGHNGMHSKISIGNGDRSSFSNLSAIIDNIDQSVHDELSVMIRSGQITHDMASKIYSITLSQQVADELGWIYERGTI